MGLIHSPRTVTDGLVLHLDAANVKSYPGSGTTWTDMSGNGNNGTLVNGPTFNTGSLGNIQFDGIDDYIELQKNDLSINPGNFTCECVFNYDGFGNTNTLFSLNYYYPSSGYLIRQTSNNSIIIYSDHGSETSIASATTISSSDLYHLVVTQLDNQCKIYLNGALDRQQNLTNPVLDTSRVNYLGRRGLPALGAYLNGNIFSAKLYNRALTEAEIKQNFNALRGRFGL
jgi:hypothetical protein